MTLYIKRTTNGKLYLYDKKSLSTKKTIWQRLFCKKCESGILEVPALREFDTVTPNNSPQKVRVRLVEERAKRNPEQQAPPAAVEL